MKEIFENVLKVNAEYVALVNANASADEQTSALNKCAEEINKLRELGLLKEYGEYCKTIRRTSVLPC